MKRVLALAVALLIAVFAFTACGTTEFEVNFMVDGEVYDTIVVNEDTAISLPTDPTKDGYTFDGWFLDDGVWQSPFTNEVPVTDSITVYAKFTPEAVEHTHTLTKHEAVAPDCTTTGSYEYWSCSGCGKNFSTESATEELASVVKNALGHSTAYNPAVASTCTADGYVEFWRCVRCNKNFSTEGATEELDSIISAKLGHSLTYYAQVDETCTTDGTKERWHCARCFSNFTDETAITPILSITIPKSHKIAENGICSVCYTNFNEGFEYAKVGESYTVTAFTGVYTDLFIPATFNGLPVTAIADEAFFGLSTITSVAIPNSITEIGDRAFSGCSALTTVTLGNGITKIGASAFEKCYSLLSIKLPQALASVGTNAFLDCYKLVEVFNFSSQITVNKGETANGYIGYYALEIRTADAESKLNYADGFVFFDDSSTAYLVDYIGNQTAITIPGKYNGISYTVNKLTFFNTGVAEVTIPDTMNEISDYSFALCSTLKKVTMTNSVTKIGVGAFSDCVALETVILSSKITSIEKAAFAGCTALKLNEINDIHYLGNSENPYLVLIAPKDKGVSSCIINAGTRVIYPEAFMNCTMLTNITIPNGVITIGESAFEGCTLLSSVVIPESVSEICSRAFANCSALSSIDYKAIESKWKKINKASDWDENSGSYTVKYEKPALPIQPF